MKKIKDNSIKPKHIDEHTWYYKVGKTIEVVHEIYMDGKYIRTDQFKIKLTQLIKSK